MSFVCALCIPSVFKYCNIHCDCIQGLTVHTKEGSGIKIDHLWVTVKIKTIQFVSLQCNFTYIMFQILIHSSL